MLGAIIGDIIGSVYEFNNKKRKDFHLFTPMSRFTDDTVMTLAVAEWLTEDKGHSEEGLILRMQDLGRRYPYVGYGGGFRRWLYNQQPKPYNSYGNGAAMRVSPIALYAQSLEETLRLATISAKITHNHPEGMKGAEATAVAVYLAKTGKDIQEIRDYINQHYYTMDFTLDEIRDTYRFNESCQGTVPQALQAFFESTDFEDAIRNAISIGGDSDTVAAICGGVAQAYYGIPTDIRKQALSFLDTKLLGILTSFEEKYMSAI